LEDHVLPRSIERLKKLDVLMVVTILDFSSSFSEGILLARWQIVVSNFLEAFPPRSLADADGCCTVKVALTLEELVIDSMFYFVFFRLTRVPFSSFSD
jgi:hypothetical protein